MSHWYLLIGPVALLPVVALLAFVGCAIERGGLAPPGVAWLDLRFTADAALTFAFVRFRAEHPAGDGSAAEWREWTLPGPSSRTSTEQIYSERIPDPALVTWTLTCEVDGFPSPAPSPLNEVDLAGEVARAGASLGITVDFALGPSGVELQGYGTGRA